MNSEEFANSVRNLYFDYYMLQEINEEEFFERLDFLVDKYTEYLATK